MAETTSHEQTAEEEADNTLLAEKVSLSKNLTETPPRQNLAKKSPTSNDILVEGLPSENLTKTLPCHSLAEQLPHRNTNQATSFQISDVTMPCKNPEDTTSDKILYETSQYVVSEETVPCENLTEKKLYQNQCEIQMHKNENETQTTERQIEAQMSENRTETKMSEDRTATIRHTETGTDESEDDTQMSKTETEETQVENQTEEPPSISNTSEESTTNPEIVYTTNKETQVEKQTGESPSISNTSEDSTTNPEIVYTTNKETQVERQTGESPSISSTSEGSTTNPGVPCTTLDFQSDTLKTDTKTVYSTIAQTDTKQKTNDGHGVFSVEDNHSLTDYLSSSFVTSDDGTLSSSAEWCCGCGACGNDSGFLSGGLCSFGGDISPRMSTPRTRTQDNHQQTYEEKVIKNLEPEIVTSHTLDQIEEAIFAEEQCHGLRFASAPLEAHSIAKKISNKGRDLRSKDFAVIEGIPTTKTEDCAVTEGKHTTEETISSSYLPLDLPDFPTESLRLEPATEEPRRHVLTKKTVHVKAKEVSMSSSGVVEAVFTSGQRESEENGEGRSAQSQVTDHRAARADAATVSQAEGGVAVTQTEHMSEEETSAEGRSMPRRLLPEVVRVICHAISRPENPYF